MQEVLVLMMVSLFACAASAVGIIAALPGSSFTELGHKAADLLRVLLRSACTSLAVSV